MHLALDTGVAPQTVTDVLTIFFQCWSSSRLFRRGGAVVHGVSHIEIKAELTFETLLAMTLAHLCLWVAHGCCLGHGADVQLISIAILLHFAFGRKHLPR